MTPETKSQLLKLTEIHLTEAIDGVFQFSHGFANTKSGDISPEQNERLKILTRELAVLIYDQTLKNI